MRIRSGSKLINRSDVEQISFFVESVNLYVTSVGLATIWYGPFRRGRNFLEIHFCVLKLGI